VSILYLLNYQTILTWLNHRWFFIDSQGALGDFQQKFQLATIEKDQVDFFATLHHS
jgi:hypothetical protein